MTDPHDNMHRATGFNIPQSEQLRAAEELVNLSQEMGLYCIESTVSLEQFKPVDDTKSEYDCKHPTCSFVGHPALNGYCSSYCEDKHKYEALDE